MSAMVLSVFVSIPALAQEDFSFTSTSGQRISVASLRGKVIVLMFSSTQDPQCRSEFKALQSLNSRYLNKGVSVFWVNIGGATRPDQQKSSCGQPGDIQVLQDSGEAAYKHFSPGVRQLPTIVVLDKQGKPEGKAIGGFSNEADFVTDVSAIVDSLLARK